jgi:hypothetical protein
MKSNEFLKILIICFLTIELTFSHTYTLLPPVYCQENKKVVNPIKLHAVKKNKEFLEIYFKKDDKSYQDILLIRIVSDINNDGLNDIAIGNSFEVGNAGINWEIYLGQKDGTYRILGKLLFHPLAFFINRIGENQTEYFAYNHISAEKGYLTKFIISNEEIKEETRKIIYPTTKPKDGEMFNELFNAKGSNIPSPENCFLHEYIEKGSCKWELGYFREEKK